MIATLPFRGALSICVEMPRALFHQTASMDTTLTYGCRRRMSAFFVCPLVRHVDCAKKGLLVKVWVILDRPPNDPLLRKKEPFTSSKPQANGSKEAFSSQQSAYGRS